MLAIGWIWLGLGFFLVSDSEPQTAADLVARSIAYHDPQGKWPTLSGTLILGESRPSGDERDLRVTLDIPGERFIYDLRQDGDHVVKTLQGTDCSATVNGETSFSPALAEKYRTSCEQIQRYRNYYLYLYGLPMKLRDPGGHIQEPWQKAEYQGKPVLAVRVTYDPEVGQDVWDFYFDPETYALVGYRFFRPDRPDSGEYILLEGEGKLGETGIRLPQSRAWYTNKDDRYLGTDRLKGFSSENLP